MFEIVLPPCNVAVGQLANSGRFGTDEDGGGLPSRRRSTTATAEVVISNLSLHE